MTSFFILNGPNKRTCNATDSHKAAEILRLMFHSSKGYVVEDNKITFAQNMTIEEAEIAHGIKPMQSMTVLPVAPKAAKVKPKKAKPAKSKAKKTTLKSKVVIKNNKKTAPKKAVVKSKVKPKTKAKAKKPVAKVKAKVKGKNR